MRTGQKTCFVRRLRREMTDVEHSLWHHLRNRALMGYKFRRQHPIGPYVVDFACVQRRLVVELDGGQHSESSDGVRARYLQACGYALLRFWNNDVFQQHDAVLAAIFEALQSRTLTPNPSPASGRGARKG